MKKYQNIYKVSLVVRPRNKKCFEDHIILQKHLVKAAESGNMTPKSMLTDFLHGEKHIGFSLVLIVQESHIAVYTYPEHGVITIDAETCSSKESAEGIVRYFKKVFKIVKESEMRVINIAS